MKIWRIVPAANVGWHYGPTTTHRESNSEAVFRKHVSELKSIYREPNKVLICITENNAVETWNTLKNHQRIIRKHWLKCFDCKDVQWCGLGECYNKNDFIQNIFGAFWPKQFRECLLAQLKDFLLFWHHISKIRTLRINIITIRAPPYPQDLRKTIQLMLLSF